MRNTELNLQGSRKLVIPSVNTTNSGLHSFRYTSANMWNKLTEDLRSLTSLNEFRTKICQLKFLSNINAYLYVNSSLMYCTVYNIRLHLFYFFAEKLPIQLLL